MALIGRLFVILFAFLFACLAAGMIVVGAVLYPEFSDLGSGPIDQGAINVVLALSRADRPPCRSPSCARQDGCEPGISFLYTDNHKDDVMPGLAPGIRVLA